MELGPLGDNPGLALEMVLLKPALDVGSRKLTLLRTTAVFHDRTQRPGHPLAQQVVVGPPVACARGRSVIRRGRGTGPKILVAREGLCDEVRADDLAVPGL